MSGYMIAEVWCDECGDRIVAEDEGTLRDLRANLREDGWRRVKHPNSGALTDYCEPCATTHLGRSSAVGEAG